MQKFLKVGSAALAFILGSTSLAVAYDAEHSQQTRPTTQIGAVIVVADDDDNGPYRWRQHQPRWQSGWDDDDRWDDEDDDDDGHWDDDDDDD